MSKASHPARVHTIITDHLCLPKHKRPIIKTLALVVLGSVGFVVRADACNGSGCNSRLCLP